MPRSPSRLKARGSLGLYSIATSMPGSWAVTSRMPSTSSAQSLGVVALERVVEAVLAEPEGHEPPAGRGEGVDAALGQVDRGAADGRVRVGEGAGLERRVAVVAHGETVERQAEVGGDADRVGLPAGGPGS